MAILTDAEFEALVKERRENKRIIKDAGYKVCVVKRTFRLIGKDGIIETIPSYCSQFDIYRAFATIVEERSL